MDVRSVPRLGLLTSVALVAGCLTQRPPSSTFTPKDPTSEPARMADYGPGVVLTEDLVRRWTATRDDETIEGILEDLGDPADAADDEAARAAMDRAAASADLDAAVRAHGFSGAEEWLRVRARVLAAMPDALLRVLAERDADPGSHQEAVTRAELADEMRVLRQLVGPVSEAEVKLLLPVVGGTSAEKVGATSPIPEPEADVTPTGTDR